MTNLYIKGTSKTPQIDFKPGFLQISGRSIPEDSSSFFEPVLQWIDDYFRNPKKLTRIHFQMDYVNSNSNRVLFTILKKIDEAYSQGHNIIINWYYEEDDEIMKNLGKDFQVLVVAPFKMVELV